MDIFFCYSSSFVTVPSVDGLEGLTMPCKGIKYKFSLFYLCLCVQKNDGKKGDEERKKNV